MNAKMSILAITVFFNGNDTFFVAWVPPKLLPHLVSCHSAAEIGKTQANESTGTIYNLSLRSILRRFVPKINCNMVVRLARVFSYMCLVTTLRDGLSHDSHYF